jgi:hypothetical protein
LHDARTGARDWEGKGAADILRADAHPASLSDALMAEAKKNDWSHQREDDRKTIFPPENKMNLFPLTSARQRTKQSGRKDFFVSSVASCSI